MRAPMIVLALGLLAAPANSLVAQGPQGAGRGGPGGPVAALLENRAELGLSAEQVTRLEAIRAELDRKNQPVQEQLRQLRGDLPRERPSAAPTPEQRESFRAQREQARPLMEQMRANAREAAEQARAVLTDQQRGRAESLLRDRRGARGDEARGQRGGRDGRGSGMGRRGPGGGR